jgi:hypothetical protein
MIHPLPPFCLLNTKVCLHLRRQECFNEGGLAGGLRMLPTSMSQPAYACNSASYAHTHIPAGDGSVGVKGGLVGGLRMLELQLKGALTREANLLAMQEGKGVTACCSRFAVTSLSCERCARILCVSWRIVLRVMTCIMAKTCVLSIVQSCLKRASADGEAVQTT